MYPASFNIQYKSAQHTNMFRKSNNLEARTGVRCTYSGVFESDERPLTP
jgi:hypothetical protein